MPAIPVDDDRWLPGWMDLGMRMSMRTGWSLTILYVWVLTAKSAYVGMMGPGSIDTEPMLISTSGWVHR